MKSPQDIIDILNGALAIDPIAISKLVHFRVLLNDSLLKTDLPLLCNQNGEMGILGILNGLLFYEEPVRIAAVVDEDNPDMCIIQKFKLINQAGE
jgi:hypothetical protein